MDHAPHPRNGSARRSSLRSTGVVLVLVVLGLVTLVVAVQVLMSTRSRPQPVPVPGTPVVVVGIRGLASLPATALEPLWASGRPVSAASVSEPAKATTECALAVWATLGAGRTTSVGPMCTPTVADDRVTDWEQLRAASAVARPDAELGTLAGAVPGCVQAVGPDAAVAAAHPDGTVSGSTTLDEFLAAGARPTCALTMVDLGTAPLSTLEPLLRRTDTTVVLLGVRPGASGQAVEALQWFGSEPSGWLTSPSTRRPGVVTLPDLTRTLVAAAGGGAASLPVDGALLQVTPARLSPSAVQRQTAVLQGEPHALVVAALVLGGLVAAGFAALALVRRRGRGRASRTLLDAALVLPAALALTGLVPWQLAPAAGAVLVAVALVWTLALAVVVPRCARALAMPTALVAGAVTLLVLTADAATGGLLQRGSLLDVRPLDGGRWYGFGNTTFAVYAAAVLVVVGSLAGRGFGGAAALLAVLALVCEASPSMGADLGGVLALAPPLLWLLLRSRGRPVGLLRMVAIAAGAVGLGAAAAVLDWLRGPQRRTHLGGFVQSVVDGSATAVVVRKADAVLASIISPVGLLLVGLTALCWWYVVGHTGRAASAFPGLPAVVAAVGATAVLGTLDNDSGVVVGAVLSVLLVVPVASLATQDGAHRDAGRPGAEQPPPSDVGRPVVSEVDP